MKNIQEIGHRNACPLIRRAFAPWLTVALLAGAAQADFVAFTPDRQGSVSAPVVGIGATSEDYLLTHSGDWATLPQNFNGNNQETPLFANPSTARDAASFDDLNMFQLSTGMAVSQIRLSDGEQVAFNNEMGTLGLGGTTFGIGYSSENNTLGYGGYDGTTLTLASYDLSTSTHGSATSLGFDATSYGTPSGLDYVVINGTPVFLVATRGALIEEDPFRSYVLAFNGTSGNLLQHTFIDSESLRLNDVHYHNGRLTGVYENTGGDGYVQSGAWAIVPEPSTAVLLFGGLLLVAARSRRSRGA